MPHSDQSVPAQQSPPEHHRAFPPNPLPHSERPSSPARRSSHHSAPSAPAAEAAAAAEVNTLRLRGLPPAGNGGLWWPDVPGYEIHGELGRGGMGVVYKARQRGLNRLVALKMVLAGAHASAEELHRFLDEAEAVAKLRHPHIVQVYDLGIQDNRPFYSMELVEGTNLEQYLADTPQPPDIAARLVALLARAVDYAHQRGIVHRDLKPANILLASGGREPPDGSQLSGGLRPPLAEPVPKITDFGLAKHLDRSVSHTQTGVVMG